MSAPSPSQPPAGEPQQADRAKPAATGRHLLPSTFRLKLALTAFNIAVVGALLALVTGLVSHIFSELTPSIHADLEAKARRGASELMHAAEYPIVLREEAQIRRLAEAYTNDPDVIATVITDGEGQVLVTTGQVPLPIRALFEGTEGKVHASSGVLTAWAESAIEGAPVGRAAMVVSTERVNAGARLKRDIMLAAAFGGVLALLATLGFVGLYVGPLIRVTVKAFEELEQATQSALKAARLKGEFIANVSHEIRTPMNGVLGMIQLLLATELSRKQKGYATKLRTSANALMSVLNDVLDFSKIDAQKLELRPRPVSPSALVNEVVELFQAQAELKSLALRAELSDSVPDGVLLDPDRMRQVLSNLVGNAVKFTEHGSVTLSLTAKELGPGRVELSYSISDTGVGIPEGGAPELFEAFSQIDGSLTRRHGGTGLGLAISKRLVSLMGGEISVSSALGQGSVFTVRVAADEAPLSQVLPRASEAPGALRGRLAGRGRLLVAEDNPVNREVLSELLAELGCEATLVENGAEAVTALENHEFSAVLMDCQMPVLDGYEATRRIRAAENGRRTPIVAVTAHAFHEEREKTRAAGMDEYLTKPIALGELAAVLDRVLPKRDLTTETSLPPLDPTHRRGASVVRAFMKHVPGQIERIKRAVAGGDSQDLAAAAHRLKGSCLAFGATRMTEVCAALEAGAADPAQLSRVLEVEFQKIVALTPSADEPSASTA